MNNDYIAAVEFTNEWDDVPHFLDVPVGSKFRYHGGTDLWQRVGRCHIRHLKTGTTYLGFPHPATVTVDVSAGTAPFKFAERKPAPGHTLDETFPSIVDAGPRPSRTITESERG